jgi:Fe-S cluster assembly protein SufB
MELSTYFRINTQDSGQFERTLIRRRRRRLRRLQRRLHRAAVRYESTARGGRRARRFGRRGNQIFDRQNWYAGDESGKGGIYNFVTKRGACRGEIQNFVDAGRNRQRDYVEISVGDFAGR